MSVRTEYIFPWPGELAAREQKEIGESHFLLFCLQRPVEFYLTKDLVEVGLGGDR